MCTITQTLEALQCSVVLLLYFSIALSFKATFVTEIDTMAVKRKKKQEKDTFKTTWHLHNQNPITHSNTSPVNIFQGYNSTTITTTTETRFKCYFE